MCVGVVGVFKYLILFTFFDIISGCHGLSRFFFGAGPKCTHMVCKNSKRTLINSEVRHRLKNREREHKPYSTSNATKTDRDRGEDKGLNTRG